MKVQPIVNVNPSKNPPQKPKKQSWTDGEKFKMMFSKEMRHQGGKK